MIEKIDIEETLRSPKLLRRILIGAVIGLAVILVFVLKADEPVPAEWGRYWRVKPLLVVPLAGATGALFYHFMDILRRGGGWLKIVANILSAIVFVFGIWIGIVLGLNGTMWN